MKNFKQELTGHRSNRARHSSRKKSDSWQSFGQPSFERITVSEFWYRVQASLFLHWLPEPATTLEDRYS
jgi:hypothetical protein